MTERLLLLTKQQNRYYNSLNHKMLSTFTVGLYDTPYFYPRTPWSGSRSPSTVSLYRFYYVQWYGKGEMNGIYVQGILFSGDDYSRT